MDWPVLAAIASGTVAIIAVIGFWINLSDRITKAQTAADAAREEAKAARESAALISSAFSLYREQVASEYIHRETMREVENRLTQAIERLGDRFDKFLQQALDLNRKPTN